MKIDFPEADLKNPTQCIALAIDHNIIHKTLDFLNERYPKEGKQNTWKLDYENYFFYNNVELASTINKLIDECTGSSITKDVLADLALQELIVRIIQTQSVNQLRDPMNISSESPMLPVIEYIQNHITDNITLKDLSDKACMSTSSFFRYFKRETGRSPIEFILHEKIRYAKKLLSNPHIQINEVSFATGFEDSNYFIRLFKKHEGVTPKQYRLMNGDL
jgi:AraC-like DNA-binding protein